MCQEGGFAVSVVAAIVASICNKNVNRREVSITQAIMPEWLHYLARMSFTVTYSLPVAERWRPAVGVCLTRCESPLTH